VIYRAVDEALQHEAVRYDESPERSRHETKQALKTPTKKASLKQPSKKPQNSGVEAAA